MRERPPGRRGRRPGAGLVVVLTLAATAALSGCGSGSKAPTPAFSSGPVALWNPCDGLPLASVEHLFGASMTVQTGTPTLPECSFTPTRRGDPVVNANYQLFPGTMSALIASFDLDSGSGTGGGTGSGNTTVLTQAVPHSDGARLVVQVRPRTLLVTGYVKDGDLVQTVNVVDPSPWHRPQLIAATHGVLVLLSEHAEAAGVTGATGSGTGSGTPSPAVPSTSTPPTPTPPSTTP